jgi:hypothetical protein
MDATTIITILEEALEPLAINLQVIAQEPYLYIYLNRAPEQVLDYPALTTQIAAVVRELHLDGIQGICLYSRPLGETEPDWETYVDFTPVTEEEPITPPEETPPLEESPIPELIATETPPVEESPIPELITTETPPVEEAEPEVFRLSNYCFISNQAQLTETLQPPPQKIIQLVQSLQLMSELEKEKALNLLKQWTSDLGESIKLLEVAEPVRSWLRAITRSDPETTRKTLLWVSRYCLNPEETLREIAQNRTVDDTPRKQPTSSEKTETNKINRISFESPITINKKKKIPLHWLFLGGLALVLPLGLGFIFFQSKTSNNLCSNYQREPNYCQLALQMIEAEKLQTISQDSELIATEMIDKFQTTCDQIAHLKDPRDIGKLSKSGAIILPRVYLADVQGVSQNRTICILRSVGGKVNLLAAQSIPIDWPNTPFESKLK